MAVSIRVIYEDGLLRPLEPIALHEGEIVSITIQPTGEPSADAVAERLRAAGLLEDIAMPEDAEELTAEERLRIGRLFTGERPVEDLIDEERTSKAILNGGLL
jgi:predicted DNA-binding antitoxin AbrB/MazE fold protein